MRKVSLSKRAPAPEKVIYNYIQGVLPPRERIFLHRPPKKTLFNPLTLLKRGIAKLTDFFVPPQICRTAETKTFRKPPPFQQPPPHRPLPPTPFEQNIAQLRKRMPRIPLVLEVSSTDPNYLVPAPLERIYEEIKDDKNDLYVADWDEDDYIVIGRGENFRDKKFYGHYLPGKVGQLRPYNVWLKGRD